MSIKRHTRLKTLALSALTLSALSVTTAHAEGQSIINGTPSAKGAWPFMTALIDKGASAYQGQFCGASFLGDKYVLTAAHCVDGASADEMEVSVGIHNLKNERTEGVRVGIAKIYQHSGYNKYTMRNDVAVLVLKKALNATPVKLASAAEVSALSAGDSLTVMGWGNLSTTGQSWPSKLYQVSVPFVDLGTCLGASSYNPEYNNVSSDNICAGLKQGGKDSCQGDSGGPLVRKIDGQYKQVGIVSWGIGCAQPNAYGVYSNVGYFDATNWIQDHTPGLDLY